MSSRFLAGLVAGLLLLISPLSAQTTSDDSRASSLSPEATLKPRPPAALFAPEKSTGGSQLALYFVALVALAGVGFYFLKRGLPLRGTRLGENRLNLLETKMLGNRQFLVVVQYEDNKLLLGVGPGQIQYLCPLESADADLENLLAKSGPASGPELA